MLLVYRRYYGTRLMLRLLALFWAVMSVAGLITEGIFRAAGLVPTVRPAQIAPAHFSWNDTTYLNVVFLGLFALLWWTYRHRARLGGGQRSALDPVCGMQVETGSAPARVEHEGQTLYFCSDHCRERFVEAPERYVTATGEGGGASGTEPPRSDASSFVGPRPEGGPSSPR
jgi:uncharacterized protein